MIANEPSPAYGPNGYAGVSARVDPSSSCRSCLRSCLIRPGGSFLGLVSPFTHTAIIGCYDPDRQPHIEGRRIQVAQKVEVTLIDDLDGGKADETVAFSLGGTQYVIDLSEKNATAFRSMLAKYIEAARKEKGARLSGRGGQRKVASSSGPDTSEVRTWAREQGYEVSERGRVSKDLIVKFEEAHG